MNYSSLPLCLGLLFGLAIFIQNVVGEIEDDMGWIPEMLYQEQMGDEGAEAKSKAKSSPHWKKAVEEISAWARQPAMGPEGRPLPLTGSWMAEGIYSPDRFVEMIKEGHHMLITFIDPHFIAARGKHMGGNMSERVKQRIEDYRPALEFAREHNLPIAIRGWNWDDRIGLYQEEILSRLTDRVISPEESVRVLADGKPTKITDPFGPVAPWKEWGEFWFGNEILQAMQEIYPDPPMVIFLNNNEGPKVRGAGEIPDDYPRMLEFLGGKAPENAREKERAIRAGYQRLYQALFDSAREALIKPAWKKNVKFVAYNNLWDTGYIGQGGRPREGIWFENEDGWLAWQMYAGDMPEIYDNDWQPGKTDYTPWSPQTEAMNYYGAQDWVFEQNPDAYYATISWDGERVSNAWRGRRAASKTYTYATRGQQWDFDRYEGWVQFTLWAMRPREYREFRGNTPEEHRYLEDNFMAVVRPVDRPWNHPVLREFWKFGELVPNAAEKPWFNEVREDHPQWLKDMQRWHLLTTDANPPRETWENNTVLRVFALALVLGEEPERRWLVYAHAPRGAVADVGVALPGFGEITLESVPRSGSFYLVEEKDRSVQLLLPGGPAEIQITADTSRVVPGGEVTFSAEVTHAPEQAITGYSWDFGDGAQVEQGDLQEQTHTFTKPGEYVATIKARTEGGNNIQAQAVVFVGDAPAEMVVYDLSLQRPFDWEGPWDAAKEEPGRLITYRHLPNAGQAPPPVVSGGKFVEDEERGMVLEISEPEDGIWLARNQDTVMHPEGHPDKTISFWFKADDTEKRQILFAQGHQLIGFNIYLQDGKLYAGSFAPIEGEMFSWFPVPGRNFDGHWLVAENIEPDQWYHVALVLKDATEEVEEDKLHLFLNGKLVESGPGVMIPRQYGVAYLGQSKVDGALITRFHDGESDVEKFQGRFSGFRYSHDSDFPAGLEFAGEERQ